MSALQPPRRIVTAIREDGRSYFAEDASAAVRITIPSRPGYSLYNIWRMTGSIGEPDSAHEQVGINPPAGGNVLRIIDIPPLPKDPELRRQQFEATFGHLYKDGHSKDEPSRAAGMHVTQTVDYAIVLQGELVAIMDEGELVLKPGDVLIQRGTYHAWENRTDDVVRALFVLIDAKP